MFMNTRANHRFVAFCASALALLPVRMSLAAETGPAATQSTVVAAPVIVTQPAQPKLPYGVDDVLKLSRAQIGDDVIINYIKNSGTIYNLASSDIVYLKSAGVSERVINTMLDQKKQAQFAVQTPPAPTGTLAPTGPEGDTAYAAPTFTGPDAGAPADTAVQAPLTPPASSVTVVPYPAATAAYYGSYYPYYGYYGYPGVTFAFGFGPGYYGHGYYGHGYYGHGYYGHGSYAVHGGGGHGGGGHGGGGHGGHR